MQDVWQAWTFVDLGPASSGQDGRAGGGGGDATDCAGGGFLPVEAAGCFETVAGAYSSGRGACTLYDPKVIVGAKTVNPEGDAYCGS